MTCPKAYHLAFLLAASLLACNPGSRSKAPTRAAGATKGGEDVAERSAAAPTALRIHHELSEGGETRLFFRNYGGSLLSFATLLHLERRENGGWKRLSEGKWMARESCAETPRCIELAPGAEFQALAWSREADSQACGCAGCPLPEGVPHQMTVVACDRDESVAKIVLDRTP